MADNPKIQRCQLHDYREPCIYLLTVTVEGRKPLLGRLEGDMHTAHIELTPLGEDVRHELYALCDRYPQLRLLQYQIMPDHVHVILQATERLSKPIGSLFASWRHACGVAYARTMAGASAHQPDKADTKKKRQTDLSASLSKTALAASSSPYLEEAFRSLSDSQSETALAPRYLRLFSEGYNDSILRGREQLQHMIAYVRDNPRRLLLKRQCCPYFTIHRSIDVAGLRFDAIGNLALLQRPLLAVHCRRRWTDKERQAFAAQCLKASEGGAILIGAFISKAEQEIAHTANERRHPLIHIVENGFPELYKPVGQAFYACAEGRLLLLAPWEYHAGRKAISREQCNALNIMAEIIASQH